MGDAGERVLFVCQIYFSLCVLVKPGRSRGISSPFDLYITVLCICGDLPLKVRSKDFRGYLMAKCNSCPINFSKGDQPICSSLRMLICNAC